MRFTSFQSTFCDGNCTDIGVNENITKRAICFTTNYLFWISLASVTEKELKIVHLVATPLFFTDGPALAQSRHHPPRRTLRRQGLRVTPTAVYGLARVPSPVIHVQSVRGSRLFLDGRRRPRKHWSRLHQIASVVVTKPILQRRGGHVSFSSVETYFLQYRLCFFFTCLESFRGT